MDERIESFLADVLALEGERPETVRQGVRTALTDCEAIYRAQETNRRMKDKAVQACHSLCRARLAERSAAAKGNADGGASKTGSWPSRYSFHTRHL